MINTSQKIKIICNNMEKVLLEKNKRYGDSALNPINVFSKLNATDSIKIRLDDKLNRIKNGPNIPRINDVCDTIGYCILLLASMDIKEKEILALID